MTVAVIVPVHNGRRTLGRCLDALRRSLRRPDRVIVVDDASTDGSGAMAKAAGATTLRTGDTPVGPAAARNRAARTTDADVLVFVDSDVEVHEEAIGRLVRPFEQDLELAASFGSYDDDPASPAIASTYANLRHHHVHQQSRQNASTFWAGLGAVRREAFLEAGGFDESFRRPSIEDIELGRRLASDAQVVRLVPEAQGKHLKDWSLRQLWRTDILQRAVPWSRLLARDGQVLNELNTSWTERLSAVAAHLLWMFLVAAILIHPVLAVFALASAAAWISLNRSFLALLARRGGWRLSLGGAALHWIYHLYASGIYGLCWFAERWRVGGRLAVSSRVLAVALVSVALVAGLASLIVSSLDPAWLHAQVASLDRSAAGARLRLADIVATQDGIRLAGLGYLAAALVAAAVGPKPWPRVIADARLLARQYVPSAFHAAAVAILGLGSLALLAVHANQTLRLDEAGTFLNYGTRPIFVALSHPATNNHVLHSILMHGSVSILGDAAWSIRLPAIVITLLSVPAMYFGGRALFSGGVGLVAAALFAGAAFTIDVGTNARGYPLVILAFLVSLALLPAVARRRPAAMVGLVVVAALGAWAVRIMLYPFAIVMVWLLISALLERQRDLRWRRVADVAVIGSATGALVLMLYAPSFVMTGFDRGLSHTMEEAVSHAAADRLHMLRANLEAAWRQWVYPMPAAIAVLTLGLAIAGGAWALYRRRSGALLVVASVVGCAGVLVLTGFAAPPWWSMAFLFPLYVLFLALALHQIIAHLPQSWARPGMATAVLACFGGQVILLGLSEYPSSFPHSIGYDRAPELARYLDEHDLVQVPVFAPGTIAGPVNYYLYRRGHGDRVVRVESEMPDPMPAEFAHIGPAERTRSSRRIELEGLDRIQFELFSGVAISRYSKTPGEVEADYPASRATVVRGRP